MLSNTQKHYGDGSLKTETQKWHCIYEAEVVAVAEQVCALHICCKRTKEFRHPLMDLVFIYRALLVENAIRLVDRLCEHWGLHP